MDLEAIALHKLAILVESKNGTVLLLNTDCITCNYKDNKFDLLLSCLVLNLLARYFCILT